jgi:restriction system protein
LVEVANSDRLSRVGQQDEKNQLQGGGSMKNYYRIMLGPGSKFAEQCEQGNFIGVDFLEDIDLTNRLPENWRDFNKEFVPIYLSRYPEKNKVTAGLACGSLWTLSKGIRIGDIVVSPNGKGEYLAGEIASDYEYQHGSILPHRRRIRWFDSLIERTQLSASLRNALSIPITATNLERHREAISQLIAGFTREAIKATDETIEDPYIFALEMQLEDFLVKNWKYTELGRKYEIYQEDGQIVGQQYPSDTGPIDILAISKDKKEILVIELKKGKVSDVVVGQIQRYMGYVKEELAEKNQTVKGAIIAFESDNRLSRALSVTNNIEFYTYKVSFKLEKG